MKKWNCLLLLIVLSVFTMCRSGEEGEKSQDISGEAELDLEWIEIEGGTFLMGSEASMEEIALDEKPHEVTVNPFKITKYAITFEQFDAFCRATDREMPADNGWGRAQRPVINISWQDAVDFANWVGGRLPTEAEWEYACLAGATTFFHTGNCLSTEEANFNGNNPFPDCSEGNFVGQTLEVGSFPSNDWGLYDMHGNVWEWVSNWYGPYPDSAATDPRGPESGDTKVLRGGAWNSSANHCRCSFRISAEADMKSAFTGFRLVQSQ